MEYVIGPRDTVSCQKNQKNITEKKKNFHPIGQDCELLSEKNAILVFIDSDADDGKMHSKCDGTVLRKLFFQNFLKFNTKMNDIFKLIESLRKEDQFPNEKFHNKNQFTGPSETAQEFNTFFISQFTSCDRQYGDFHPSVLNGIEFSLKEVIETLLQTSDGMGSDNMSGATIRTIATPLSVHFLGLARSILETAKYPDNWKLVDVKPLHKKRSKEHYSQLSACCQSLQAIIEL